jgi:hypothetical protein
LENVLTEEIGTLAPKHLILNDRQMGLLSAGMRHARDAEHLFDTANPRRSIDQAYHLAGFGPECTRKAIFSDRWFDKVIGHQLGDRADFTIEIVISLDPFTARYQPRDWASRFPALSEWNENCRYEKTGRRTENEVNSVLQEARAVVDELVLALWMDGRIDGEIE